MSDSALGINLSHIVLINLNADFFSIPLNAVSGVTKSNDLIRPIDPHIILIICYHFYLIIYASAKCSQDYLA